MAKEIIPKMLRNFFSALWGDWLARMSGGFSVPFGFFAVLVDSKLAGTFWALLAASAFGFAAYRIWAAERLKVLEWEEFAKKKIRVDWRFEKSSGLGQLILTNVSIKTITGVDVKFRNYMKADGSPGEDILCSLVSTDDKFFPITLNPNDPTYFTFCKLQGNGTPIAIMPGSDRERQIDDKEIGVKLSVSGTDIRGQNIRFQLTRNDDQTISIESWELGKSAVEQV